MKDEILKLRNGGKSYSEIAKILGCSNSLINYYCGKRQEIINKWTKDEIEFLMNNAKNGIEHCVMFLNKTKGALRAKARKLKIKFEKKIHIISDEERKNISDNMKKAHSEGRHPGWSHINSDINRRSYPEKFFLKIFSENNFFNQFKIEEKFSYGKYFIDFLIVELKLIIEIDGSQHYRTMESIDHDNIRDNYFMNEGFKVYRIKWSDVCKDVKSEINELIDFINNVDNETIRKYVIEDCKKIIKKCKCGNNVKYKKSKNCMFCKRMNSRKVRIRPDYDSLRKEVEEFGYCAIGRKYGVSDNSIRKWLNRKMPHME